jgi:aspartate dehydrogenase
VLAYLGAPVLAASDPEVAERLVDAADAGGTSVYLPRGAGRDRRPRRRPGGPDRGAHRGDEGIRPPRFLLHRRAVARRRGRRTALYDGPVRGLCRRFPRNFNSHAAVALASLGLDETHSALVVDPAAGSADHVIAASGEGFDLEVTRESAIAGVAGEYTPVAIWGRCGTSSGPTRG